VNAEQPPAIFQSRPRASQLASAQQLIGINRYSELFCRRILQIEIEEEEKEDFT